MDAIFRCPKLRESIKAGPGLSSMSPERRRRIRKRCAELLGFKVWVEDLELPCLINRSDLLSINIVREIEVFADGIQLNIFA